MSYLISIGIIARFVDKSTHHQWVANEFRFKNWDEKKILNKIKGEEDEKEPTQVHDIFFQIKRGR